MEISKKNIFLGTFIAVVVSILLGGYLYFDSYLEDEKIKRIISNKIEEVFPGGKVSFSLDRVSLRSSIYTKISNLELKLKREPQGPSLLEISSLTAKIPLWSILLGGGNVEISIKEPKINFLKKNKVSNWSLASDKNSIKSDVLVNKNKDEEKKNISLPAFIINSTLALRIQNLEINHSDHSGPNPVANNKVLIEKLVLKNLGITSNAAFEVETSISKDFFQKKLSFRLVAVGSVGVEEFLRKSELKLKSNIRFMDVFVEGGSGYPTIVSNLDANLNREGTLQGKVQFISEQSSLKFNFVKKAESLNLDNINGEFDYASIINFLDLKKEKRLRSLQKASVTGSFLIDSNGDLTPKLQAKLISLSSNFGGSNLIGDFDISVSEKDFNLSGSGKVFDGEFNLTSKGKLKVNEDLPLDKKLSAVLSDVKLKNIVIPQGKFDSLRMAFKRDEDNILYPEAQLSFDLDNANIMQEMINGGGILKFKGNRVSLRSTTLLTKEGKLTVDAELIIFKRDLNIKFNILCKNFPPSPLNMTLSKRGISFLGPLTGKLKGEVETGRNQKKSLKFELNGDKVTLANGRFLDPVFKTIELVKNRQIEEVNKGLDKITFTNFMLVGGFDKDVLNFKESRLSISEKDSEFIFKGTFTNDLKKKTRIYIKPITIDGSKAKARKLFGGVGFPIKISGQGLLVDSDIKYTFKKLKLRKGKR